MSESASRRSPADAVPSTVLVLGAVASVQTGASLAKSLFDEVGPGGTVLLRVLLAAVVLVAIWRPRTTGIERRDWLLVVMAGAGILLLSDPFSGGGTDAGGAALALLAGAFWAAYILLSARAACVFPGGSGLTLAMVAASAVLLPFGIAEGGSDLLDPDVLLVGAGVAMLSSAIPYSLELEALRRLPAHVFGVLMSLEPGMAALVGFVVLGEVLGVREVVAIGLVVAASAGAARAAGAGRPPTVD